MARRRPAAKPLAAELVRRYDRGELNATEVARRAGIARPTALRRLRAAGADTSRRLRSGRRPGPAQARRDAKVIRLYREGLTMAAVARRLGLTRGGVRYILNRSGVPSRRRVVTIPPEVEGRYRAGELSVADVARLCGGSADHVRTRLTASGAAAERKKRLEASRRARAAEAAALYRGGLTATQVGDRLRIGQRAVLDMLRRLGVPRRPRGTPGSA